MTILVALNLYFSLYMQFFRTEIYQFAILELSKLLKLISRKNLRDRNIAKCPHHSSQWGNCRNSLSHFFHKNFVKAIVLLKKLQNKWFDEIFPQWENSLFFHTALCSVEFTKIYSHTFRTKISWKYITSLLKKLLWFDEIFFVESKFFIFPQRAQNVIVLQKPVTVIFVTRKRFQ